ncbi:MAG: cobalamin-dependent protein [Desulfobulbaceae bacterium]|nr:cobalamin-dependent protein [Desulfobulbaceae bacterium]
MHDSHPTHPLKTKAKVLLSNVFGPYARDDEYGSRQINPMELYHNQVTRAQGVFSLRMFHRSFGLLMIQANIEAPSTLLDFPDLERFEAEIRENEYDIVGISSIIPNVGKVKKMCELVRNHLPNALLVIGGHVANLPDLAKRISADHIVKGDGIAWFRRYLGQDCRKPIRHPHVLSAHGTRILGHNLSQKPGDTAAIVVPSVGCPMGCNFCSTSNLFGGKGKFINFYETGDELFEIMCELEEKLQVSSFFMMDENFLLHRKRALRLLELQQKHNKSWSLYIFSSARVLQSYSMEQLVSLGVSWVWMGLEGQKSRYRKLNGIDTLALVKRLQAHGVRVLGSSIIGLENHTLENIDQVIDYAVSHNTDFHQFMLYTALPGTPLHRELQEANLLLPESEMAHADSHGQYRFNHRHPHIKGHQEEKLLPEAFRRDFEKNGPSLYRLIKTMLKGWLCYKDHQDTRIRKRYTEEMKPLRTTYAAAVWAMQKWYSDKPSLSKELLALQKQLYTAFGWKTRLYAPLVGRYIHLAMRRETKRLAQGWTPEPVTFCEKMPARQLKVREQSALSKEEEGNQLVESPLLFPN